MKFYQAIDKFSRGVPGVESALQAFVAEILPEAIKIGGTFPSSSSLLKELYSVSMSETISKNHIVSVITADPLLSLRVLSVANSTYYARASSTETLSDAVNQMGFNNIYNVAADTAKIENFSAVFHGRAVSCSVLHEIILSLLLVPELTDLLSSEIRVVERARFVASLLAVGDLMLAFYRPDLYSILHFDKSFETDYVDVKLQKLLDYRPGQVASQVAEAMSLPKCYRDLAEQAGFSLRSAGALKRSQEELRVVLGSAHISRLIAHEICSFHGREELRRECHMLSREFSLSFPDLMNSIRALPEQYCRQARLLGISISRLPDYLVDFGLTKRDLAELEEKPQISWPSISQSINPYIFELKACFEAVIEEDDVGRVRQAVYCTLLALVRGLRFDRAVLMMTDSKQKSLRPIAYFGLRVEGLEDLVRFEKNPNQNFMPDIQALLRRAPVFNGDPVFEDGWPFAAFPIIWRDAVMGVFYADKRVSDDSDDDLGSLEMQEQMAVVALSEAWRDIPDEFF